MPMKFNVNESIYKQIMTCIDNPCDSHKANLVIECAKGKLDFTAYNKSNKDPSFLMYNPDHALWEDVRDMGIVNKLILLMLDVFKQFRPTNDEENMEWKNKSREFMKKYYALTTGVGNTSFYTNGVLNLIQERKCDSTVVDKLNQYIGVLQYRNGALCLKTGKLLKRKKDDYVTWCLPWNYTKSLVKASTKKKIRQNLLNICNSSEEDYKSMMSWLGYCLIGGNTEQLFSNLYGPSASNGKSTMMKIVEAVFCHYVLAMNSQTFNLRYDKKHKALDGIKPYCRIAYIEEPQDSKQLDISLIKDFTSARYLNTEVLYGTTRNVKINCVANFITNYILKFHVDNGMERRGIVHTFNNKFINEDEYEKVIKQGIDKTKIFKKDDKLIDNFQKDEYKMCFVSLILDVIKEVGFNQIYNLAHLKNEWKKACTVNDSFYDFLEDNFNITRDKSFVTKEDFLDLYKDHHKIQNVSLTTILNHIKKHNLEYDRQKMVKGKKGVIYGLRIKDSDGCLEEEDQQENDIIEQQAKEIAKLKKQIANLQGSKIVTKKVEHDKRIVVDDDSVEAFLDMF